MAPTSTAPTTTTPSATPTSKFPTGSPTPSPATTDPATAAPTLTVPTTAESSATTATSGSVTSLSLATPPPTAAQTLDSASGSASADGDSGADTILFVGIAALALLLAGLGVAWKRHATRQARVQDPTSPTANPDDTTTCSAAAFVANSTFVLGRPGAAAAHNDTVGVELPTDAHGYLVPGNSGQSVYAMTDTEPAAPSQDYQTLDGAQATYDIGPCPKLTLDPQAYQTLDDAHATYASAADPVASTATCTYRSPKDRMACRNGALVGGEHCKAHTCEQPGCVNAKSSRVSLCDEHATAVPGSFA